MIRPSLRLVRTLLLSIGLLAVLWGTAGCAGQNLEALQAPSAGVSLEYDLTAGQQYTGHVFRKETVQTQMGNINRSLEYDINLMVLGEDPNRGDTLLQATFTNVRVDWTLGPNAPPGINLGEFVRTAEQQIQGMQVRFNVGEHGKINYMPPPPQEGVSQQLKTIINSVLESVEGAFLVVPDKAIEVGESWEDEERRGRKGKLGRYREGLTKTTFEGLYRHTERDEEVAKLVIEKSVEEVITTKAGSRANEVTGQTTALFSTTGDYLGHIEGELRKFDPKQGTTFTKIQAEWHKTGRTTPPAQAKDAETQKITDPCHPDYVGPVECKTQSITDPCDFDYVGPEPCEEPAEGEAEDADEQAAEGDAEGEGEGDAEGDEPAEAKDDAAADDDDEAASEAGTEKAKSDGKKPQPAKQAGGPDEAG